MDLALYLRVIWRFKVIVALGFLFALALAFLSLARIELVHGKPVVRYRHAQTWESTTRLLVTQPGFQEGRVVWGSPSTSGQYVPAATPQWLAQLAQVYQQLANGDAVQKALKHDPTVHGGMRAVSEWDPNARQPIPVLDINGIGPTPADAEHAGARGAAIFMRHFKQQQIASGVSRSNRVELTVLNNAKSAQLLVKRKTTLPVAIFITVLAAALGLCFILENLRPRIRVVAAEDEPRLRESIGA